MDGRQTQSLAKQKKENIKVVAGALFLKKMGVHSYISLKPLFASHGYI